MVVIDNNIVLNRINFMQLLKQNDSIIIFKLGAKWCGPCKYINDHVINHVYNLNKNIVYYDIDVDKHPDLYSFLKSRKQLIGVPTLLAYYNGNDSFSSDLSFSGSDLESLAVFFNKINSNYDLMLIGSIK